MCCPNQFTGKEYLNTTSFFLLLFLPLFFIYLPQATPPMLTLWDEQTSIAQCSTKCYVSLPSHERKRSYFPSARTAPSNYPIGPQLEETDDAALHTLSWHVEGREWQLHHYRTNCATY